MQKSLQQQKTNDLCTEEHHAFFPTDSIQKRGFQIRIFKSKKLLGDAEKTGEVNLVIVTRK
jgi:hypothetical protein